ncbi:RNA polymerase sigma factor [Sphingopyxis sp. KK2]|uniref:RNA polymerase sigma factor n=1 Tax=Sphingopyxis sp. KK2 TaxID=1855727 RepID=UPI00097E66C2|nr:RNA polymerase sigma factor [Sphingopyxis sp. KK2]
MSADLSQLGDQQLAARARGGHEDGYRALLGRYKAAVYRLIVKHVGDADEAMDLTQETFVAAFAALDRYDGTRPFRIWISRIALNKCRDWARRRTVRAFFARALPLDIAHHVASESPLPDIAVADRLELARVREAVAALPAKLREVLLLRSLDEMSQSEVAAILGVSEKAVETRLYRARARLRVLLGIADD